MGVLLHGFFIELLSQVHIHAFDLEILLAHALHLRTDGVVAQTHGDRCVHPWGDAVNVILLCQYIGILCGEGANSTGGSVAPARTGINRDGIGTHGTDVFEDFSLRAFAQCHHRNHRGNPDDDAEHGEKGAHAVREHGAPRHGCCRFKTVKRTAPRRNMRHLKSGAWRGGGCNRCNASVRRNGFIRNYFPITQFDDSIGIRGDARIVGHDNYSVTFGVQFAQNLHDLRTALRIQRTRWLIGEYDFAAIDQCAGNAHALLLSA